MSTFQKFDPDAALRSIRSDSSEPNPAKAAKPAKAAAEPPNFSSFRNFSSPRPDFDGRSEDRCAWSDELVRDLHRWLSVHDPHVWRAARIWEVIEPQLQRLETLLADYDRTGEPGDRKAAVFAANAVAAAAARAAREWLEPKPTRRRRR